MDYQAFRAQYFDSIKSKYDKLFNVVAQHATNFTDDKALNLGMMLENTNERLTRVLNETTNVDNIKDGIKTFYTNIISATYPNCIADEIFTTQPLTQKIGQIFYLRSVYGDNKGKIKKGDTMFGPNYVHGYDEQYAAETIDEEALDASFSGSSYTGNLSYLPVKPGTVTLMVDAVEVEDKGDGTLAGTGFTGTIDYATGAISITGTFSDSAITANYEYDLSYAPTTIPQINLEVTSTLVTARPRKLRGLYSVDAEYDMKVAHNVSLSDLLMETAASELRFEVDGDLINTAYNAASTQVSFKSSDYGTSYTGITKRDYLDTFVEHILDASETIRKKTRRCGANWIVVGSSVYTMLAYLGAPRFAGVAEPNGQCGPFFAGTLDGRFKVYVDPFLGDNQYLLGYKGDSLIDTSVVYAPYLPFFATETYTLDDLQGRRGFCNISGKKVVNSDYLVRGTLV